MFNVIRVSQGGLLNRLDYRGHTFGACMTTLDSDLMYVQIPKNASSWTKIHFKDLGWLDFNYHYDHFYKKHALVVLRDPVERWLSGVCEYFSLYHENIDTESFNNTFYDFLIEQTILDDHTESQHCFIEGLDYKNITFFLCNNDYRLQFSTCLKQKGFDNKYHDHEFQHTTNKSITRSKFKKIFEPLLSQSKYLNKIQQFYKKDYELINSVKFYAG
jgi:hypothetical protein